MEDILRIFFGSESVEALGAIFTSGGTGVVVVLPGRPFDDFSSLRDFHFLRDGLLRFLLHTFIDIDLHGSDEDIKSVLKAFDFLFDFVGCGECRHECLECRLRLVRHGFLTTTQEYLYLYFVTFAEELLRLFFLEEEIMFVGAQTEAYALGIDFFLLGLRFLFLLCLLVLELAVIHDTADRRFRLRRDFDEIESCLLRDGECLLDRESIAHFSIRIDQLYDWSLNLLVHAEAFRWGGFWFRSMVSSSSHRCIFNEGYIFLRMTNEDTNIQILRILDWICRIGTICKNS